MKTNIHRAAERGHADHGWLNAHHSFSFASWYDPNKTNFGVLRVLNDDIVAKGMGFGKHPHENMEIITLVQQGVLRHQDSMGHTSQILPGEVQVMSAGTGIYHSEFNDSKTEELRLFQIWVFPNIQNVNPRYDQKSYASADAHNKWQTIIAPIDQPEAKAIGIYQQAWFSQTELDQNQTIDYTSRNMLNGAYVFVIEGSIKIGEVILSKRDAMGISEYESFKIEALESAKVLVMDVPMVV